MFKIYSHWYHIYKNFTINSLEILIRKPHIQFFRYLIFSLSILFSRTFSFLILDYTSGPQALLTSVVSRLLDHLNASYIHHQQQNSLVYHTERERKIRASAYTFYHNFLCFTRSIITYFYLFFNFFFPPINSIIIE